MSIGFRDGAYQNGGNTNGATFSVIATPPNETPEVLFRRTLRPVQNNEDRGDQRVDVELPALAPGSELKVVIDPDGSHAWDWTYVTDLRLD